MRRFLALMLTAVVVVLIAPNLALAQSATVEPPVTPVGVQVAWLLEVSSRLRINEAEADEHFSPELLAAVPLADINAGLAAIAGPTGLTLVRYEGGDSTAPYLSRAPGYGSASWASTRKVDQRAFRRAVSARTADL